MADKLFKKLWECDIQNLKEMFLVWRGKGKKMTGELEGML